jgi:hypothetical protein
MLARCLTLEFNKGGVTREGELAERETRPRNEQRGASDDKFGVRAPSVTLPKGDGTISWIGEKFAANPMTGTGSTTLPVFTSPGRSEFGPQLSLSHDSGAGNGPFGVGWNLSIPSITQRTDKGLPKYSDAEDDIFILSGAEDLVPVLVNHSGQWARQPFESPANKPGYVVQRYRPRIEGLFARIERWRDETTDVSHFRATPYERNRLIAKQFPQRYLKNIRSGNRMPARPARIWRSATTGSSKWCSTMEKRTTTTHQRRGTCALGIVPDAGRTHSLARRWLHSVMSG